jgi:hypothetical protein
MTAPDPYRIVAMHIDHTVATGERWRITPNLDRDCAATIEFEYPPPGDFDPARLRSAVSSKPGRMVVDVADGYTIEQVPADEAELMRSILATLKGSLAVRLTGHPSPAADYQILDVGVGRATTHLTLTDEEAALWERIEPTS